MAPRWGSPQLATAPLLSLLLLFLLPVPGGTATLSAPRVRYHTFANGLGLYHVKVDEATSFKLSVAVWVGSADESPDKNGGVSHLLEHILFRQPDTTLTEFTAQIKSRGGTYYGGTARDYTYYSVTLPAQHLDSGQQWLYKVLFHDRLVTDRLAEEKEIVNRENGWSPPTWWQRLWDLLDPDYLELPGFWEEQFGLPKYDEPAGGTYKVASQLTGAQLEAHYRAYYYPENMVLVYAGPHELTEVVARLRATFGNGLSAGRKANLRPPLESQSARLRFSHELPEFFSEPEYKIRIGHVYTDRQFSQRSELALYQSVLRELLMERLRYEAGKTYSVSSSGDYYQGAGYFRLDLQAPPDTYWEELKRVKDLVWGDLGEHLSPKDFERYKTTRLEQVAANRDAEAVHDRTWWAIYDHPLHRPSPEETDIHTRWRTFSHQEFLDWVRLWRAQSAPLLRLSMPAYPIAYAHLLAFVLSLALGVYLAKTLLRRPFPHENIKLISRVPYGIPGWVQLAICYAAAAFVYFHLSWGITYASVFWRGINAFALLEPYLDEVLDGLLIGLGLVLGGLVMPRKVLVTDGTLVLKMWSPLFFRIPLRDIESVAAVSGWTAWAKVLRLSALPVYPWFFRGLLIRRRSGPALVLHTTDDQKILELLSSPGSGLTCSH
ncbi:MAG: insulinase family protein [Acidobacteria bacterium]|nr:insulinase family protein [Acidobacteriota bacterium]